MNERIMIVVDDEDTSYILEILLSEHGFQVIKSVSDLVINNVFKDKPDLILMDVWLSSGKKGDSICEMLKANPLTKHIPVILISAIMDLKKVAAKCLANGHIEMPFDIDHVVKTVKESILIKA